MLQTCAKDKWGLPRGQAILTFRTGQLDHQWSRTGKKIGSSCNVLKRRQTILHFHCSWTQVCYLPSHPVHYKRFQDPRPTATGWIYTAISWDPNTLHLPHKSKPMLPSVGFQNSKNLYGVLATKSEYRRNLCKIYCATTNPSPQPWHSKRLFSTKIGNCNLHILLGRNHP